MAKRAAKAGVTMEAELSGISSEVPEAEGAEGAKNLEALESEISTLRMKEAPTPE